MIYDRFQYHNYKYVIGVIDMYSRYAACIALTNMIMETIMEKLKEMFEGQSPSLDLSGYPENVNCDSQFDVPEFTNFFTQKGTNL